MNLSALPNLLCILRMLLAVPVVYAIVHERYLATLGLFFAAAVTDGLDGWLAKRFGWTSEAGKVLDPLADKLLLMSVFLALALDGLVPLWLALTVVLRDIVIGAGAGLFHRYFGPLRGRPTLPSKLNTLVQIACVLVAGTEAAWPSLPDALFIAVGAATFVTTVVSGIDYVITYGRRAVSAARPQRRVA